jgi:hypothetical protein
MHNNVVYARMYGPKGLPTVMDLSIQLDEARLEWRHRDPKPLEVGVRCRLHSRCPNHGSIILPELTAYTYVSNFLLRPRS